MDAGGSPKERSTAVLDVHPMRRATEKNVIEAVLGRRPGVERVDANPVAQTATVTYDSRVTSLDELRQWVEDCGYHCAGQSVPEHICDPLMEPDPPPPAPVAAPPAAHAGHRVAPEEAMRSPQ